MRRDTSPGGKNGGIIQIIGVSMEMIDDLLKLLFLDSVAVNPVFHCENLSGLLGVELISSALGKKILSKRANHCPLTVGK